MIFLIISFLFISMFGTLAHFLYDLSNHNKFVGVFAAVNESTWEHIKICLTPTILWSLVDGYIYGMEANYFLAKLISLVAIIVLMPLFFYGHRYIAKKDYFIFDIVNFYIVIICSQLAFYFIMQMDDVCYLFSYLSCIGFFIIFGLYMILSLLPLKNFIFKDPITNKYGYKAHSEEFSIVKNKKK